MRKTAYENHNKYGGYISKLCSILNKTTEERNISLSELYFNHIRVDSHLQL